MRRIPTALLALFLASLLIDCDFESERTDLQPVEGLTIRSYANDGMAGTYTVDPS